MYDDAHDLTYYFVGFLLCQPVKPFVMGKVLEAKSALSRRRGFQGGKRDYNSYS